MDVSMFAAPLMVAIAVGGIAYVFLYPLLSGERRAEKRQAALVGAGAKRIDRLAAASSANRRDQIAQSLKEIEARQTAQTKLSLDQRLARAGLDMPSSRFYVISAISGVVAGLVLFVGTGNAIIGVLAGFSAGLGLPRLVLSRMATKRVNRFVEELPNAIDIIVRGIRSGLPLGDCMREIAFSAREPLRTEFRLVMEAQAMGVPLSEAIQRVAERIPVAEANFFAIVIAIQSKAGGNLSEALGNLSRVLRERKKMKGKVQAMSMEAKASAAIIASLPFIVALLTYVTSPDYVSLLWTTLIGKIVLAISAFWMMCGVLIMRKMINFEI